MLRGISLNGYPFLQFEMSALARPRLASYKYEIEEVYKWFTSTLFQIMFQKDVLNRIDIPTNERRDEMYHSRLEKGVL